MAASEPSAPIAIPTSALESEGASFMPSPTNITEPNDLSIISESFSTLSDGRSLQVSVLLKKYQEDKRYEMTRYQLVTPELINEEEIQQLWPGASE